MASLDTERARWVKVRFGILIAAMLAASVAVAKGAWNLGVVRQAELRGYADDQYKRRITLPARRGMITDRHGEELAVEVEVDSVYADAGKIKDPGGAALLLASALDIPAAQILEKLGTKKHFVWIARRIAPDQAKKVRALKLEEVQLLKESKRFYPNKELASHVVGFAGIDSVGLEGIERQLEEQLKGRKDAVVGLKDARGRVVFADSVFGPEGVVGNTVELTIDKTLQNIAEEELLATVRTFNAKGGHVIVMEPNTGEIFALANWPNFNPNAMGQSSVKDRRCHAVIEPFEPGSTLKVFTLAAAFNTGAVRPDERIYCERGIMTMGDTSKVVIHDDHRDELLTPNQCLKRSSNICFAKMALKLGKRRLYNYMRRFGFGEKTEIELPYERVGILRHYNKARDVDAAMMGFGQGVSVTGIQMATAMAAVANGGMLMKPQLVRRLVSPDGETLRAFPPTMKRRVISRYTAQLVADIMTSVTEEGGTGVEGALDGFLVAGKTGTAQKSNGNKGYTDDEKWVASFIGFVPSRNPRLVISVVIDEPLMSYYGGTVAAPTLRRIADRSLKYMGVSPNNPRPSKRDENAPRVTEAGSAEKERLPQEGVEDAARPGDSVALGPNQIPTPNLSGMSMQQVMAHLSVSGLRPLFQGTGIAWEQLPAPGTPIERGQFIQINFSPTTDEPDAVEVPEDDSAEPGKEETNHDDRR